MRWYNNAEFEAEDLGLSKKNRTARQKLIGIYEW
jgi:hypothetical protein